MTHNKREGVAKPVESRRYLSPTPPHPMSYVGAILSPIGGDCKLSSTVLQSTPANDSSAIALHQMACQCKRPCCRPGRRNVPWAPNQADEAIPSHPLPTMGGTSTLTTTHTKLVCANNRDTHLPMSSASPPLMTLPSPSLQALQLTRGGDSMIPSATMVSFFYRGSVHNKSSILVVSVGATAFEPPIHRSLVADADIGL